jgi:hypothetical protein
MTITFSYILEITTALPSIGCQPKKHFAVDVVATVGVVSAPGRYTPAVEYYISGSVV